MLPKRSTLWSSSSFRQNIPRNSISGSQQRIYAVRPRYGILQQPLRAATLKDLKYKLPAIWDNCKLSDGNGGDLEMFWRTPEFVGLRDYAQKIEARIEKAINKLKT